MTDISKEAVDRTCWWLGEGGEGPEVTLTRHHSSQAVLILRALQARVEELTEQLDNEHNGYDVPPGLVRELLRYEPDTGKLFWRQRHRRHFNSLQSCRSWNSNFAGKEAFTSENGRGYLHGAILFRSYRANRVIWAHVMGEWPKGYVDHINGDRSDNRIANLRDVTPQENNKNQRIRRNNTSGAVGVCFHKRTRKWVAGIRDDGKRIHLGSFENFDDAVAARKAAEQKYGFHPNHGNEESKW